MPYQFGQPWTPVYRDTVLNHLAPRGMFGAPTNSLAPRKRSTTETVHDKIRNALAPIAGNILANKVSGLFDYSPGAAVTTGYDLGQDIGNSNYNSALNNAIATGLNVMPDVGPLAKVGGAVAHSIIAPLWHGSPHKFEKFALEKIGTGEGNQSYGHGLYFAENPAVAQYYKDALGPSGHVYQVQVDANPEDFLNWDAPLSQDFVQRHFSNVPDAMATDRFFRMHGDSPKGMNIYSKLASKLGDPAASKVIQDSGLAGIQYFDQMSRGAANGSRNYVVFDPSLIDIVNRH